MISYALNEVSIEVPDGSLTALLGPSGSGKSTLLRVIAGLEQPDSGRIIISGQDMTKVAVQDRHVGFCFQHYAAFKHMTVRDNVAFGLSIRKKPKDEIEERVRELLRLVHLEGFIDRYPSQLSGGQRQRMALARALAVEPKVLLLDEPFGALDAKVREELRAWLRRLHDEMHVTTIFVTHDQEEAMDVAEQIVVMNDGKVEQAGGAREIYEHPTTEFVMGFVGPVNRIGQEFIRPHDLVIQHVPEPGAVEAMIDRIVHLGFEVRVELLPAEGPPMWAQLTREQAELLELGRAPDRLRQAEPQEGVRRERARGPRSSSPSRRGAQESRWRRRSSSRGWCSPSSSSGSAWCWARRGARWRARRSGPASCGRGVCARAGSKRGGMTGGRLRMRGKRAHGLGKSAGDDVGQSDRLEHHPDVRAQREPDVLKRLGAAQVGELLRLVAVHRGDGSVDGADDFGDGDHRRGAREVVAAVCPPAELDDVVLAELVEDVLEEPQRDVLADRDLIGLHGHLRGLRRQLDRGADGVISFGGDAHGRHSIKDSGIHLTPAQGCLGLR